MRRILVVTLLAQFVLTGCAGIGGDLGVEVPEGAPYIVSTLPSNGETNVFRYGIRVEVFFQTPMNPATQNYFSMSVDRPSPEGGQITGRRYWLDDYTLVFEPDTPLNANTIYRVTITGGTTMSGEPLINVPYFFTFTAGS